MKERDQFFEERINQISPEVLETFTDGQIQAIYTGFGYRSQTYHTPNHTLDLRMTIKIPLPKFKLYLLLLAGVERRSQTRLLHNHNNIFSLLNFLLFIGGFSIISSFVFICLYFIKPSFMIPKLSSYPTSIPWIKDEEKCQQTEREWKDNKCWDYQHNPDF